MVRVRGNNIVKLAKADELPTVPTDNAVTVVIPCYKQSKFLRETVQSVLGQTVLPKQIIILLMDKDSWALQNELGGLDPRIHTVCSGRKLLPSARNFCIGLATTEYVIPLDADDLLQPNFIEATRKIDAFDL